MHLNHLIEQNRPMFESLNWTKWTDFVGTRSTLHRRGGGDLLVHHQRAASTWKMRRQPYCTRTPPPPPPPPTHTSYRWRGERVMQPISVWGWLGGHRVRGQWGEFGQDTGVKPVLFTRSAMGFLMTTESQDLGLTSHLKDGACWLYSVSHHYTGVLGPS